jgi:hypothetical protein
MRSMACSHDGSAEGAILGVAEQGQVLGGVHGRQSWLVSQGHNLSNGKARVHSFVTFGLVSFGLWMRLQVLGGVHGRQSWLVSQGHNLSNGKTRVHSFVTFGLVSFGLWMRLQVLGGVHGRQSWLVSKGHNLSNGKARVHSFVTFGLVSFGLWMRFWFLLSMSSSWKKKKGRTIGEVKLNVYVLPPEQPPEITVGDTSRRCRRRSGLWTMEAVLQICPVAPCRWDQLMNWGL